MAKIINECGEKKEKVHLRVKRSGKSFALMCRNTIHKQKIHIGLLIRIICRCGTLTFMILRVSAMVLWARCQQR